MSIELDHVVFEVTDPEATLEFYRGVLGLEPVRLEKYRTGEAPFLSARVNGGTILDFFPKALWENKRRAANPNHFCLAMEKGEVRKIRRRIARRGIPIVKENKNTFGGRDYGVSMYINDPDGNMLEVKYYQK